MLIRPARLSDIPGILDLARLAGAGLTSLPVDEARITARVAGAEQSFAGTQAEGREYIFVLEDPVRRAVAGICALDPAVGSVDPWYNFRIGTQVHASRAPRAYRAMQTLTMTNDLTGTVELCTLFLHPEWRRDGLGRLLSRSRFLFIADARALCPGRIIAEMRGVSDAAGRSPFWDALGRHFFDMEYAAADRFTGLGMKAFIAELMPRYPIYTIFLPESARAVIGQVHEATRPARALLEQEVFRFVDFIDIFDGGAVLTAEQDQVRCIRDSRLRTVRAGTTAGGTPWLVSNRRLADFRCVMVTTTAGDDHITVPPTDLEHLGLADGDVVRAVPVDGRSVAGLTAR